LSKTAKAVGLFIAAALTVYACSDSEETYSDNDECYDENNDGYCDDDGSPVGNSYIDIDGKKKYKKFFSGVSSGAKGGIGSSGVSSSG
jgi:hypothetical protein